MNLLATNEKQYIIFKLNNELHGIDISYIDSIIVMQKITRIPKSQSHYKGVINLRGDIVPVMSLRLKFGKEEEEYTSASRIIIVRPEPQAAPVGLIVDQVLEVVNLDTKDIDKISYEGNAKKVDYNIGIGKHGNDLVSLLNVKAIVLEDILVN
ncbi:MAG: purine-binding chemotaxis protein CheW [Clostridiales bacterium]|nr:purine-binding chemotaxis protein CheW [Clostridiales bacterium]